MNKDTILELRAVFKGEVQGVGFRWTVVEHAEKYQLKGSVKNLSNGSVEVFAQGSKDSLVEFLKTLQNNPGYAKIRSVQHTMRPAVNTYTEFKIIEDL